MPNTNQEARVSENREPSPVVKEHNTYGIVTSSIYYGWFCPECNKLNYINELSYVHNKGIDECVKCERAINVMEPKP